MFCFSCGKELPEGAAFCINCGTRIPTIPKAQAKTVEQVVAELSSQAPPETSEVTEVVDQVVELQPEPEQPAQDLPAEEAPEQTLVQPIEPQPEPEPLAEPQPELEQPTQVRAQPVDLTGSMPAQEQPTQVRAQPVSAASTPFEATPAMPTANAKPKKSKAWMVVVGIVAALALIGGGVYSYFHALAVERAEAYAQAQAYYDAGQYAEAREAFEALEDYENSPEMAAQASLWIDAQALEAAAGEDPDAWRTAAEAYALINEDEADARRGTCQSYAAYYDAVALMNAGNWAEASEAFSAISFLDSAELKVECDTHITYEQAEALLAEGSYYDAYVLFDSISDRSYEGMPDFSERASACVQSAPASGAVWSNPDYNFTASNIDFTIKNSDSYFGHYYKFYDGDVLVVTVYVAPNESAVFNMPAGTYRLNEAYGYRWFGTEDMFGDEGYYTRCNIGGSETFELQANHWYEMSFEAEGEAVSNTTTDRDSF